ncbi:uncharacterized protein LOC120429187 [Culex pipiens pallens]|uniref:uncharacterized protein LOC120429187 n=1 Tax=Culex pipiens pallens TaxID=42434 RepID=UPI0022AA4036|nr:uncharacterized protein LOC120429187 [Culex pipiens pallens]
MPTSPLQAFSKQATFAPGVDDRGGSTFNTNLTGSDQIRLLQTALTSSAAVIISTSCAGPTDSGIPTTIASFSLAATAKLSPTSCSTRSTTTFRRIRTRCLTAWHPESSPWSPCYRCGWWRAEQPLSAIASPRRGRRRSGSRTRTRRITWRCWSIFDRRTNRCSWRRVDLEDAGSSSVATADARNSFRGGVGRDWKRIGWLGGTEDSGEAFSC